MSCFRVTDLVRLFAGGLLVICGQASATDYYVDAELGNDEYSGLQTNASGGNGPWRTLAKVAVSDIRPGDSVLLKCGAIWDESPTLKLRGTAEAPITIAAYGDCEARRPLIRPLSSALPPESFRAESNGWSAPLASPPGMVFSSEVSLPRARFPAEGWLRVKSVGGTARIALADLPVAAASLAGADWVVRTNDYTVEARRLYGLGPQGEALIAKPFAFQPGAGAGYFLEGQPWMLNSSEGWAYDPEARRLHVRQRPLEPISVNTVSAGLTLVQPEYVRIQGLAIRFVAGVGVDITSGRDIELHDLDIADVGLAFVRVRDADDVRVTKLVARRSQQDGVTIFGGTGSQITDSLIEDVGVSANLRKSIAAILADSSSAAVVARNRIARTGYAAIMFGRNTVVEGNIITQACLKLADCGAIYTSGARKNYGHYASRVNRNLISDVPGNVDVAEGKIPLTAGIYLDDESRGIEVSDNFIEGAQRGIFSKAAASVFTRNTLFDNVYGVRLGPTGAYASGPDATLIEDNLIISKPGQMPFLVNAPDTGGVISLVRNQVGSISGALDSQVWRGPLRVPRPSVESSKSIERAFSLLNTSQKKQSYKCPIPRWECHSLQLSDGTRVQWPIELMPGKAVVISGPRQP